MDECSSWVYQRNGLISVSFLNVIAATLRAEPLHCKTTGGQIYEGKNTFHHLSKAWRCLAVLEWIHLPHSPLTTYTHTTHKCVKMELNPNVFSLIVCRLSARG